MLAVPSFVIVVTQGVIGGWAGRGAAWLGHNQLLRRRLRGGRKRVRAKGPTRTSTKAGLMECCQMCFATAGSTPWNALVFNTLYLQLLGFSGADSDGRGGSSLQR